MGLLITKAAQIGKVSVSDPREVSWKPPWSNSDSTAPIALSMVVWPFG
jgi:hypothetical protein